MRFGVGEAALATRKGSIVTDGQQTTPWVYAPPPGQPAYPPPPGQPQPAHSVVAQAPKPGRKKWVVFGAIGCGALLFLCVIALVISSFFGDDTEAYQLTRDQKRVVSEFGYPDGFMVAFASDLATATPDDEDPPMVRMETWEYPTLGSAFSFRNGTFVSRTRIPVPKKPVSSPAIKPESLSFGMSPEDVEKVLGTEPDTTATMKPEMFEGAVIKTWRGQFAAAFADEKLVYAQSYPVIAKGGVK